MDGCLNRGPSKRIFGGGGKLATSTCLENCSARNPDTGNECLCFLGGEGGGGGKGSCACDGVVSHPGRKAIYGLAA